MYRGRANTYCALHCIVATKQRIISNKCNIILLWVVKYSRIRRCTKTEGCGWVWINGNGLFYWQLFLRRWLNGNIQQAWYLPWLRFSSLNMFCLILTQSKLYLIVLKFPSAWLHNAFYPLIRASNQRSYNLYLHSQENGQVCRAINIKYVRVVIILNSMINIYSLH